MLIFVNPLKFYKILNVADSIFSLKDISFGDADQENLFCSEESAPFHRPHAPNICLFV